MISKYALISLLGATVGKKTALFFQKNWAYVGKEMVFAIIIHIMNNKGDLKG